MPVRAEPSPFEQATAAPAAQVLPRDGGDHIRGDIEGLRAVAVVLVVLDHVFAWPRGGFIGVDVFFVISGFLITGLLLREHRRSGRISFVDFYKRRIRRILPASVLVLAVTTVAGFGLFFGSRAQDTSIDVLWALLFAGNWHFALTGTDYLQAAGPVSPVQHYWSLSVEEQFYFVWPAVLVVLLALAGRRGLHQGGRNGVLLAVMGGIVLASFGWALHETATNPSWAYFDTFSRAWELGVGALIAIGAARLAALPHWTRPVLAWTGLLGIAASAFLVDAGSRFPAPWAAAPVLGAALVIAAGTAGRQRFLWPLTNSISRYLGGLSYSLYLWHFPVIIFTGVLLGSDARSHATALVTAVVLAVASFHLVEQPIRRSNWLRPGTPTRARHASGGSPVARRSAVAAVCAAVLVLGVLIGTGTVRLPGSADAATATADAPSSGDAWTDIVGDMTASLAATSWPELTPDLGSLGDQALVPEWVTDQCLDITTEDDVARCRYGAADAAHTAVLLGDSVSISWLPGLRQALVPNGWSIQSLTLGQCPAIDVPVTRDNDPEGFTAACDAHHEWVLQELRTLHPDLIIMTSAVNSLTRLASGAQGQAAQDEWRAGMAATLTALDGLGGRVVDLEAPPEGPALEECATRLNSPADCVNTPSDLYDATSESEDGAITAYTGATPASYVWTTDWFCSAELTCPAFIGANPVFADGTHLTQTYSARLAGVLAPALLPQG